MFPNDCWYFLMSDVTSIHTWKFVEQEQTQAQGVHKKKEIFLFLASACTLAFEASLNTP